MRPLILLQGTLKKTDKGELSVKVSEFHMLSKSIKPLPDKWHGLKDVEQRYRQRYVDLIMSSDSRDALRARALVTRGIRNYLEDRDYLEMETPVLQVSYQTL